MNADLSFPIKDVRGEKWCSLQNMGVKRIDIVAYTIDRREQYTFAGGHRHRYAVVRDDIHILFPPGTFAVSLDISDVKPTSVSKRRHHKR